MQFLVPCAPYDENSRSSIIYISFTQNYFYRYAATGSGLKKANGRDTHRVIQILVLRALVYFDQINHLAIDHLLASVLKIYCDICANN